MRQWRVGTWSMGILLVAVGIILLLSQVLEISFVSSILKWWPLILVMLGVEVLIYVFLSKQENPVVKFDVFSIFIVIVLLFIGLGAYVVSNVAGDFDHLSSIFGVNIHKYESNFKKELTANAIGKKLLIVENSNGSIQMEKGDTGNIEIEAAITIKNNDKEYAQSISDSVVEVTEGNNIKIKTKGSQQLGGQSKVGEVSVAYYIKVPDHMNVQVTNGFGEITLENIGQSATIENKFGKVKVKNVAKDLTIDNSFGGIEVENVQGRADIEGTNGAITVKKVGNGISLKNAFGEVILEDIKGNATVTNNNGQINTSAIEGDITINGKFCGIEAFDIQGNIITENNNGTIEVKNVTGDAKVTNKFGDITLENAHQAVNIRNNNGNITFEADKVVEKDITISNAFGSIIVQLPKEQQGRFKAQTDFGNISSDFDLKVSTEINRQNIDQTLGEGNITFAFTNKNGEIQIKNY